MDDLNNIRKEPQLTSLASTLSHNNSFGIDNRVQVFSDMCDRLSIVVKQRKPIQERELVDFGSLVIWVIRNSITVTPESFSNLSQNILDFWRYDQDNATDPERKDAYVRLYQMVKLIRLFIFEHDLNNKAISSFDDNEQNVDLIYLIQNSPGITFEKIQELFNIPSDTLKCQLDLLENSGVLSGRRDDRDRFYFLTISGEALYQALRMKEEQVPWHDEWSYNRLYLFTLVLVAILNNDDVLDNPGIQIPVLSVIQKVGELKEDIITMLIRLIQNYCQHEYSQKQEKFVALEKSPGQENWLLQNLKNSSVLTNQLRSPFYPAGFSKEPKVFVASRYFKSSGSEKSLYGYDTRQSILISKSLNSYKSNL